MTRRSSVAFRTLWTICAVASLEALTAGAGLAQEDHPLMPAANAEIARMRDALEGEELDRFNAAIEYLAPEYDLVRLYALLKDNTPEAVIARGEVEQHLHTLSLARRALMLYYGSRQKMEDETYGLSEAEIIAKAQALP